MQFSLDERKIPWKSELFRFSDFSNLFPRVSVQMESKIYYCFVPQAGLVDGLNYGLYQPESNGRFGKFLEEERQLKEYSLSGPIAQLDVSMMSDLSNVKMIECWNGINRISHPI